MSSHPIITVPRPDPQLPTYPHMVKGNADLLTEVLTEQWDFGVPLAEVIEHDELCIHLHPSLDGLGGCAAKGTCPGHSQAGRYCCSAPRVTPHQLTSGHRPLSLRQFPDFHTTLRAGMQL